MRRFGVVSALLLIAATAQAVNGPEISFGLALISPNQVGETLLQGDPATLRITTYNSGNRASESVTLTVTLPDGVILTSSDARDCDLASTPIVCRFGAMEPKDVRISDFNFTVPAPPKDGILSFRANVDAPDDSFPLNNSTNHPVFVNRLIAVTNRSDDGPGSLRQAIAEANASCSAVFTATFQRVPRCTIAFHLPGPLPDEGFFRIRPATPLPPVNFHGDIHGGTEAAFLGVDGARPRIMIDGERVAGDADGLVLLTDTAVRRLAVGNFHRFGVFIDQTPESHGRSSNTLLDSCYAGTDGSGSLAAPNLRGVASTVAADIVHCVISGNRLSGIMMMFASAYIIDNRIGVAAGSDAPLPNGASGIFLNGRGGDTIRDNLIANHPQYGIAVNAPPGSNVEITHNSIHHNGRNAIDWGLDGTNANAADDTRRFPNQPVVDSARYAGGETTITLRLVSRRHPTLFESCPAYGTFPCLASTSWADVEVYANDLAGSHLQRYLGSVTMSVSDDGTPSVATLKVSEDLRGRWISAVSIRNRSDCYTDFCDHSIETSEATIGVRVN